MSSMSSMKRISHSLRPTTLAVVLALIAALGGGLSGCQRRTGEYFEPTSAATGIDYLLATIETASGNGKIVVFQSDLSSGLLNEKSVTETEISPRALTYYRGFVYVGNYTSGSLTVYSMNGTTGALSLIQTITGLAQISSLAIHRGYNLLYVGYASGVRAYSIDSSGLLTAAGSPVSVSGVAQAIVMPSAQPKALYINSDNDTLYTALVNSDGTLSLAGSIGFSAITSITTGYHPTTGSVYLFASDDTLGSIRTFSVNETTGVLTLVGSTSLSLVKSVEYYSAAPGALYAQSNSGTLYTYLHNPDGTLTLTQTNSEIIDVVTDSLNTLNSRMKLWSTGTTGGIYFWEPFVTATSVRLKVRRAQSVASYGQSVNQLLSVNR